MKFLNNWTIDISKIPVYSEFNGDIIEEVDIPLCDLILQREDIAQEAKLKFQNYLKGAKDGKVKVKYCPRRGCIGRRYAENDGIKYFGGLIEIKRCIKNTNFQYLGWVDVDQQKGHVTILYEMACYNKIESQFQAFQIYLEEGKFNDIAAEFLTFYKTSPGKKD